MEPLAEIDVDRPRLIHATGFVVATLAVLVVNNMVFAILMQPSQRFSPSQTRMVVEFIATGALAAQLALHSIWTVFGNWNWFWRALLSVSTALLLHASLYGTALRLSSSPRETLSWETYFLQLLCLPLVLIAIQAPFWWMKTGMGWQITASRSGPSAVKPSPMSIRGLLLATAVVAVAITCVRVAGTVTPSPLSTPEFMIIAILSAGTFAAVSFLISVPSLFVALRARHVVEKSIILVLAEAAVVIGIVSVIGVFQGSIPGEFWLFVAAIFAGYFGFLTTPLLIARKLGYRLVRAVTRDSASGPGKPTQLVETRS